MAAPVFEAVVLLAGVLTVSTGTVSTFTVCTVAVGVPEDVVVLLLLFVLLAEPVLVSTDFVSVAGFVSVAPVDDATVSTGTDVLLPDEPEDEEEDDVEEVTLPEATSVEPPPNVTVGPSTSFFSLFSR